MSRASDRVCIEAGVGRAQLRGKRFFASKDSFVWVTAMLPALLAVAYFIEWCAEEDLALSYLVFSLVFALVSSALVVGHRLVGRGAGLLVLGFITLAGVLSTRVESSHSEVSVLLIVPILGLYLGWFYETRVARLFGVPLLAVILLSALTAQSMNDAGYSPLAGVGYTMLMAGLGLESATYLRKRLSTQAILDPLTQVLNRRGLVDLGIPIIERAIREAQPLTVAVVDFDDFKRVNDEGGHAAGDQALRETSRIWATSFEPHDLIARVGGDEFVLILQEDSTSVNTKLAELRARAPYSWSWGAAQARPGDTLEELMKRADSRMYRWKGERDS